MALRALLLLPLCFPGLQGQTSEATRRREGDSLYIQCPYPEWFRDGVTKFWCREKDRECEVLVQTYYSNRRQSSDGRITMKDDSTSRTVSVTMTDLKAEDSGSYFCAYYDRKYVSFETISLNVFKELLKWELDTVSVQCPTSPWGSSMTWCRRKGQTQCTDPLETQSPATRSKVGKSPQYRPSIEYVNQQRTLTVTMKKLQAQDTGVYWCAVGYGRTRIMEVVLSVFKRTQQFTARESGNVSVQCHYKIADYKAVSKAWCKKEEGKTCNVLVSTGSEPSAQEGRVRIQDDTQQGIVTVTMEQLQAQDSGVYWCALQDHSALSRMEEVTLSVSEALSDTEGTRQETSLDNNSEPSSNDNTLLILSVVLLILLILAVLTSITLSVRYYKLLARTGNREAEDTNDRAEGTAQLGSTGRRESSQDDSKGPGYINMDVPPPPSPEDPLYCNVEPSQAHRKPQNVEYAVIAFNHAPRNDRG